MLSFGHRYLAAGAGLALLCVGCSSEPTVEFPPVNEWPSPNPEASVPTRLDRISRAMGEHPLPVDEIELVDGTRIFVSIVREDPQSYSVWMHDGARNHLQQIPRDEIARIHEVEPGNAFLHRLVQLEQIEDAVDYGPPLDVAAGTASPQSQISNPTEVVWTFDDVQTPADLPGANDIRWWPQQPSAKVSSAIEPLDDLFGRTGVWALLTDGLPLDSAAVLEVRIEAQRVSFEHSPGFWGASPNAMYTKWRFLVDDVVRYESAPQQEDAADRGRYEYERLSFTLGPGEHTLRWELRGSGQSGVYFWGLDTIRFSGVAQPDLLGEWGPLRNS